MIKFCVIFVIFLFAGSTPLEIIGGDDADISIYPYQSSFQFRGDHICSAVLISNRWALTSADCTQSIPMYDLTVRFGTANKSEGGRSVNVSNFFSHPRFNPVSSDFNIAILKLDPEVENVTFARLPEVGYAIPEGTQVTLLGWGTTGGVNSSDILQKVNVTVFSEEVCKATWDNFYTETMFCAGDRSGGKGPCSDSGGPVLLDDAVVGVIIGGGPVRPCASGDFPLMYTNVSSVREWLNDYTGL